MTLLPIHHGPQLFHTVRCIVCHGLSYAVIYMAHRHATRPAALERELRSSASAPLANQLVECTSCGLKYVNPRPADEILVRAYAEGTDERFVSQAAGRERTFQRCLDGIERYTGGRRGRVLDIGTAGGSFLHVARGRGWQVEGCEPNRWLCEWARGRYGLEIRPGTIEEQRYPSQSFDLVTLWDVLEHTADPRQVLLESHRVAANGALLVVNYPDIGSLVARAMGRRWVFLLSAHLYYFTRKTIARLLDECGFTVVEMTPHVQRLELGYVLQRARPYVGWPANAAAHLARAVGLAKCQVPYWMGQTLVVARKNVIRGVSASEGDGSRSRG